MTMMRVAHPVTQEFSKTNLIKRAFIRCQDGDFKNLTGKQFKIKHFTNSLIEFYYYQILLCSKGGVQILLYN